MPTKSTNSNNIDKVMRMSSDELDEMLRPQPNEMSQISQFYENKTILVTGACGFVGKMVIEKLLRACGGLKHIYVLIRSKKNKNPDERLKELLDSMLFDGIRHNMNESDGSGRLLDKVSAVEGDITRPLLGLTGQVLDLMVDEVNVVLHSAAVVGFEQPLKMAIDSNLIGVYNIIQLSMRLSKLHSLVYVSTAYSNCPLSSELDEHIYPVNVDAATLVEITKSFDVDTMELIKQTLIGQHPNTYTYTKCLAEWLCGQYANRLPIVICRPSVVTCTWREPIAGYLDNMNANNGVYTLIAKGLIKTALGAPNKRLDIVPVDTVANCIIALGWFGWLYHDHFRSSGGVESSGSMQHSNKLDPSLEQKLQQFYDTTKRKVLLKGIDLKAANLPVFHCTTAQENPIRQGKLTEHLIKYTHKYPMPELFRCPSFSYTANTWLYAIKSFVWHKIPAHMMDILANYNSNYSSANNEQQQRSNNVIASGSGNMVRMVNKVENFLRVVSYFYLRQWRFNPENRLQLINNFMSQEDKRLFNCNVKCIDWQAYMCDFAIGIRRFMSQNPGEDLEVSRQRLRWLHRRNSLIQLGQVLIACYVTFLAYKLIFM